MLHIVAHRRASFFCNDRLANFILTLMLYGLEKAIYECNIHILGAGYLTRYRATLLLLWLQIFILHSRSRRSRRRRRFCRYSVHNL